MLADTVAASHGATVTVDATVERHTGQRAFSALQTSAAQAAHRHKWPQLSTRTTGAASRQTQQSGGSAASCQQSPRQTADRRKRHATVKASHLLAPGWLCSPLRGPLLKSAAVGCCMRSS